MVISLNILIVIEKNSWIDIHIAGALEEMGHKVTRFYYGDYVGEYYGSARYEEQIKKNKALVDTAKNLLQTDGLNFIFCYVYDDFLLPQYAAMLEKLDVPMVNYNVDMRLQWYRQSRTAKYFTTMLCAQHENMQQLAKFSKKVNFFPMAARLPKEDELLGFSASSPVVFLGTPMLFRKRVLAELVKKSIPLSIFLKYLV